MKRLFIVIISLIAHFSSAYSNPNISSLLDVKEPLSSYGTDPGATSEQVQQRLEALNAQIEMRYTKEVHSFIDSYMKNGRKRVASLQILLSYYEPIFVKALRDAGLPEELKYLPIIESGLKPRATSPKGAGGFWQFMPATARGYKMTVNGTLDERCDPYISSEKAAELLKKQYEKFGDWGLALAAYNAGAGTVQKALKRAGGDPSKHTYWTVREYLPAETRKYVPKFIAINYVMNYFKEHNIPTVNIDQTLATDTIHVSSKSSLKKMASTLGVSIEDLKALNPHFGTDVIPATASRHCNLIAPADKAKEYKMNLGRPVNESPVQTVKAEEKATNPANPADMRKRKSRPSSVAYYDEPSSTMANTFVRKRRMRGEGEAATMKDDGNSKQK